MTRGPFPADLAFRGGIMVGMLLCVGVWLLVKAGAGWGLVCL